MKAQWWLQTFHREAAPILDHYLALGKLAVIDAQPAVDDVYKNVREAALPLIEETQLCQVPDWRMNIHAVVWPFLLVVAFTVDDDAMCLVRQYLTSKNTFIVLSLNMRRMKQAFFGLAACSQKSWPLYFRFKMFTILTTKQHSNSRKVSHERW
jgi:hypothetical protein